MHLLIIAPEQIPVPPILGGSVEICINAIARELAMHHPVTVISRQHASYSRVSREGQLTIIRVPSGKSTRYMNEVIKAIQGKSFDWIQVDNRPRYAAAIKKHFPHTPVSLFMHSLTYVRPPYARVASCAKQLAKVDWIIANSSSLEQELRRLYPTQTRQLHKIHLGTDVARFCPNSTMTVRRLRKKYRVSSGFQVLFVGRLIKRKGISELIRAVHLARKSAPQVKLLIAGGQQGKGYKAALQKKAKRLAVPAKFLGNIPHRRMHHIYGLANCFVCPSQKHEAFGLVNVEAMASGLPVIASAIGGIKEVIRHEHNGVLIDSFRDPRAFARGIVAVATQKAWAEDLAKQARNDAVEQFSWQATAQSLADFYRMKLEEKHEKDRKEIEWNPLFQIRHEQNEENEGSGSESVAPAICADNETNDA
ncbi:glycosyltransferase family 4 protein [Paenibacillus alba]|uniref:Glycosyltransferase family 4 protein n=1 Tax=Paenibacillus alba TaxID=1197127 RepID=A0ABU6G2H2_9BACL|nr:glycosyltransferase family 4 protein [Paenibacillus alba]MEC0228166.1 glycosyltransferase family 4 protein [Paenibacillus alba]